MNHADGGTPKRSMMAWIIVIWVLATAAYAYLYVTTRVALPDAVGYEADWSWQLFFFALVRLPILILILGALLYVEHRLWSGKRPFHRAA